MPSNNEILIGIYVITNKINNKKYVGQSQDISSEWLKYHLRKLRKGKHHNIYLQNSWNKHGEINFTHEILEICKVEELSKLEIYYIKELRTHHTLMGYNISWGGEAPMRDRKHTQESKDKISKSIGGKNHPFFGMKKEENPNYGKTRPLDAVIRTALANKGKKRSEKQRDRMRKKHPSASGENNVNFGKKKKNSLSRYFGVSFDKSSKNKPYSSRLSIDGKVILIGKYETEIQAAKAYNEYVIEKELPNPLNLFD